ncbi:MAG TPA: DUF4142 domain-containing protein [Polyangiaceae bacterium]|nr:DUF4142 domain-containing protein [Polyangiaceae bacterium]
MSVGLSLVLGLATLAGCDDSFGRRFDDRDRWGFERFGSGRDRDGWGGRDRWHHRRPHAPGSSDAGADAGSDAGTGDAGADAGLGTGGTAGTPAEPDAGAGASATDAGGAAADASAVDAAIQTLSDGQVLAVADALLAGEIEQARAAEPALSNVDVLAFAEQTLAEREAARSTLASLAGALELVPAPSGIAEEVLAANASSLAPLLEPDAGALDAVYLGSRDAVHRRALELYQSLSSVADAPALQAQLLVLQTLEQSTLARASQLTSTL